MIRRPVICIVEGEAVMESCIDYTSLFALRDPFGRAFYRLGLVRPGDLGRSARGALWRGEFVPPAPLELQTSMGSRAADILWGTDISILVMSNRVSELLTTARFSGWSAYPVRVRTRAGDELTGYSGLAILGRAGQSDYGRSSPVTKSAWEKGIPRDVLVGKYFANDEWDGSDFCLIGLGGEAIVTKRVAAAMRGAHITNVTYVPLTKVETEVSTLEMLGLWPPLA